MYQYDDASQDEGLGGWLTAILGTVKTIAPSVIQIGLQQSAQRSQEKMQRQLIAAQTTQSAPPTNSPVAVQNAAASASLIQGVPNVYLVGGAAFVLLLLALRR